MPYHINAFYPNDEDLELDTAYYVKKHMPLVQEKFGQYGLKGWEIIEYGASQDGTKSPYAVQTVLIWESPEDVSKALASPEAKDVFGDIKNFCNKQPITMGGYVVGSTRG